MDDISIDLSPHEVLVLKEVLHDELVCLRYKLDRCRTRKNEAHTHEAKSHGYILKAEEQAKKRLIDIQHILQKLIAP